MMASKKNDRVLLLATRQSNPVIKLVPNDTYSITAVIINNNLKNNPKGQNETTS